MPTAKASVALNDLGVLRGYGVFDFLKTVNQKPFLWTEHWRRFNNSAKSLGLKLPVGESAVKKIITDLFKKNLPAQAGKIKDGSIRLILTGGATADGMTPTKPNFAILIEDLYVYPPKTFTHGAKVITHEYLRLVPEAKTTNYITAIKLQKQKKQERALEILYTHQGRVLECSTSNFFIVKNGSLITPKVDILYGTTRNLVINLATKAGIAVEEREVDVAELKTADETFLTATNKDITPIVQIDDQIIGDGTPGPLTRQLRALFSEFVKKY